MELRITATPKEIADLVKEVQSQQKDFIPESASGKYFSNEKCEDVKQKCLR